MKLVTLAVIMATTAHALARPGKVMNEAFLEQYAATLARWYGVSPSDLPLVFPNIGRFSTPDLGFMI